MEKVSTQDFCREPPHTTLNHKPALSIGPLMLMASHQQAHLFCCSVEKSVCIDEPTALSLSISFPTLSCRRVCV